LNSGVWILKFVCEMFETWIFEHSNVWIGMCEYLKLKIENWNLYVKHLEFEILTTKMSELGCVNIESWKLKNKNVWILKTKNKNVWILKIENWNVRSKHIVHMGREHYNTVCSQKHPHKVTIYFEPSKPKWNWNIFKYELLHI
jgi:hypothetical protein